jgi:hypothetical protein
MEYLITIDKKITVHPHCVICGKNADTQLSHFIFICHMHSKKWSKFFLLHKKKVQGWQNFKKDWGRVFIQFLKIECRTK